MLTLLSSGCLNQPVSPGVFLLPRVKFYLCHQRSKTRSFFPLKKGFFRFLLVFGKFDRLYGQVVLAFVCFPTSYRGGGACSCSF